MLAAASQKPGARDTMMTWPALVLARRPSWPAAASKLTSPASTRGPPDRPGAPSWLRSGPLPATASASVARWLRIDDVGRLPQRPGYPVPQPHLLKLLHHLGEQFAQRRQVKHSWLAAGIHHPASPCSVSRPARLVSNVADNSVGNARSIGQPDAAAVAVDAWGGRSTVVIWRRVLRHQDHLSSGRLLARHWRGRRHVLHPPRTGRSFSRSPVTKPPWFTAARAAADLAGYTSTTSLLLTGGITPDG